MLKKRTGSKLAENHQNYIRHLNEAVNAKYPDHARSRIVLAKEEKDAFDLAFMAELQAELSK